MTMQQILVRVRDVLDVELFHMGGTSLTIGTLLTAVLVVLLFGPRRLSRVSNDACGR